MARIHPNLEAFISLYIADYHVNERDGVEMAKQKLQEDLATRFPPHYLVRICTVEEEP